MAKYYVGEGATLTLPPALTALTSGQAVMFGKRLFVSMGNYAVGSIPVVSTCGGWSLPKLSTDVIGIGDDLYWDAVNARLTATAAGNNRAGYAMAPSPAGVASVNIQING